jgi:hypothetical protein
MANYPTISFSSDDRRSKSPNQSSSHDLECSSLINTDKSDQHLLKRAFECSVLVRRKSAKEWLMEKEAIIQRNSMAKAHSFQAHLTNKFTPFWSCLKKPKDFNAN